MTRVDVLQLLDRAAYIGPTVLWHLDRAAAYREDTTVMMRTGTGKLPSNVGTVREVVRFSNEFCLK